MSSDYSNISQFFSHPLVLLLIGALISGVLIPHFTNRAAKYQKGLEIKTDLIRRINESAMRIRISLNNLAYEVTSTMASEMLDKPSDNYGLYYRKKELQEELEEIKKQLDHENKKQSDQKIKKQLDQDELEAIFGKPLIKKRNQVSEQLDEIDESIQKIENLYVEAENEFRQWQVSSAVIGSQIRSYFPEFGLNTERKLTWASIDKIVSEAQRFACEAYRAALYVGPRDMNWSKVILDLDIKKEEVVVQIQESSVSGLSERLFSRFFRKFTERPDSI